MSEALVAGIPLVRLVDAAMVLTLLEGLALALYHRVTGRGPAPQALALYLASGLCLMLALRVALAGTDAVWVVLCLSAAGLAHGADIWRRWRK